MCVEMADLPFLKSPKLISRKNQVTEKSSNLHTVKSVLLLLIYAKNLLYGLGYLPRIGTIFDRIPKWPCEQAKTHGSLWKPHQKFANDRRTHLQNSVQGELWKVRGKCQRISFDQISSFKNKCY